AVCSVLLFAVLVYVLFFTGPGTKKAGPSNGGAGGGSVALNPNGGSTGASGGSTNNQDHQSVPGPEPVVTPAPIPPTTRPVDGGGISVGVVPPTTPPSLTPIAPGGSFDWGGALHHGLTGSGGTTTDPVATVPPATASGQVARKYQVKPNETLWGIARAEYGNAAYVNHIIRANPGIDANRLRAGTIIILPEKTEVVPETGPARLAVAGPTTRPIDPTTQYRVQSGDNLFTIAKKLYGNINRAGKLYEANKDLIGPNPNALKLNMVLRLPEPPTAAGTPAAPLSTSHPEGTSPAVSDLR
ncbi:MAG: LysM peptidoglycan-binding domain-containing protein, partial [Tepidisphaerales bacterium]